LKIVQLEPDRVTLEFSAGEFPRILRRLRLLGKFKREDRVTYELLHVDGEPLILSTDCDSPCLISKSPRGDAMLKRVLNRTTGIRRIAAPKSVAKRQAA
jgi:hypothetical protein